MYPTREQHGPRLAWEALFYKHHLAHLRSRHRIPEFIGLNSMDSFF
jgi:hypothetical protein